MPNKTAIEWTDYSVNPFKMRMPDGTLINACVHKSAGCANCYAEGIVRRWWKKEWIESRYGPITIQPESVMFEGPFSAIVCVVAAAVPVMGGVAIGIGATEEYAINALRATICAVRDFGNPSNVLGD